MKPIDPIKLAHKINALFADVTAETSLQTTRKLVRLGMPAREAFQVICSILAAKSRAASAQPQED